LGVLTCEGWLLLDARDNTGAAVGGKSVLDDDDDDDDDDEEDEDVDDVEFFEVCLRCMRRWRLIMANSVC
jgi:hypothetical protein